MRWRLKCYRHIDTPRPRATRRAIIRCRFWRHVHNSIVGSATARLLLCSPSPQAFVCVFDQEITDRSPRGWASAASRSAKSVGRTTVRRTQSWATSYRANACSPAKTRHPASAICCPYGRAGFFDPCSFFGRERSVPLCPPSRVWESLLATTSTSADPQPRVVRRANEVGADAVHRVQGQAQPRGPASVWRRLPQPSTPTSASSRSTRAHSTPTPHGANSSHTYRRDPANPSSHGPPQKPRPRIAGPRRRGHPRARKQPWMLRASLPTVDS